MPKVHRRVAKLLLDVVGPNGDLPAEEALAHQMKTWHRVVGDKENTDIHPHETFLTETLAGVIRNRHYLRKLVPFREDLLENGVFLASLARCADQKEIEGALFLVALGQAMQPVENVFDRYFISGPKAVPTPTHPAPRMLQ